MLADQNTGPQEAIDDALAPGTTLLNGQYVIDRYLSSGGFGITYLARDSLNRTVVIKECYPEAFCARVNRTVQARSRNHQSDFRAVVKLFIREAYSLAKLDHVNVVGVHQVFEDNETAYMALDLVDGQDLLDIIDDPDVQLQPHEVTKILLDILEAVALIHSQDMLHRDISPDNILIDRRGVPVLIDFGAAREEASKASRVLSAVLVVKDGYSPQEFYIAGSKQFPCSDLYALAATFWHLITGEAPPNSQTRLAAIAAGQDDPYQPLAGRFAGYEDAFLDAIDTAMNVFPSDRLQSAEQWSMLIDNDKRKQVALARARKDDDIEKTVLDLIHCMDEPEPRPETIPEARPEARPETGPQVTAPPPQPVAVADEIATPPTDLRGALERPVPATDDAPQVLMPVAPRRPKRPRGDGGEVRSFHKRPSTVYDTGVERSAHGTDIRRRIRDPLSRSRWKKAANIVFVTSVTVFLAFLSFAPEHMHIAAKELISKIFAAM